MECGIGSGADVDCVRWMYFRFNFWSGWVDRRRSWNIFNWIYRCCDEVIWLWLFGIVNFVVHPFYPFMSWCYHRDWFIFFKLIVRQLSICFYENCSFYFGLFEFLGGISLSWVGVEIFVKVECRGCGWDLIYCLWYLFCTWWVSRFVVSGNGYRWWFSIDFFGRVFYLVRSVRFCFLLWSRVHWKSCCLWAFICYLLFLRIRFNDVCWRIAFFFVFVVLVRCVDGVEFIF